MISSSALRGTAPFTVSFSGAGSTDADGSVVAWDWSFSEGGTASGATTSRTYTTPGSYTTALRVTDNAGLSASSSVTVTVDAPVVVLAMRVADIAMGINLGRNSVYCFGIQKCVGKPKASTSPSSSFCAPRSACPMGPATSTDGSSSRGKASNRCRSATTVALGARTLP